MNLIIRILEVDKTRADVLGILPRFLKNLLKSEYFLCSTTAGIKNALGIIQI